MESTATIAEITALENRGLLTAAWLPPTDGGFPALDDNQMVTFISHITAGLGFPPSDFVVAVLTYYGLELCNLNPSAIVHLSVFVTL